MLDNFLVKFLLDLEAGSVHFTTTPPSLLHSHTHQVTNSFFSQRENSHITLSLHSFTEQNSRVPVQCSEAQ
jgi:hypothetical protein